MIADFGHKIIECVEICNMKFEVKEFMKIITAIKFSKIIEFGCCIMLSDKPMNFNGSLKHSKFESLKLVYMGDIDHCDWSHNSNRLENIISAIGNESVSSLKKINLDGSCMSQIHIIEMLKLHNLSRVKLQSW